jgi:hypothetical protein
MKSTDKKIKMKYLGILEMYIFRKISLFNLRDIYLENFKMEREIYDSNIYEILENIFSILDLLTNDTILLKNGKDYIGEDEAEILIFSAYDDLCKIQ